MRFRKKIILFIALGFSFLFTEAQVPVINSFSPLTGSTGTIVTISGNNFSSTPANNIVFFGAVRANVISSSNTSVVVNVPAGATYQPISITVNQLIAYSDRSFSTIFNSGPTFAAVPIFTQSFAASSLPYDVAITDIDGDSKPDVVASNSGSNTISVFRNTTSNDTIQLNPHLDFATGLTPKDINIADYNGDGKPDIAVVNYGAASISILKNISSPGNIAFESKTDFPIGINPSMLSSGDIDGDGKTDIVASGRSGNIISILKNTTSGNLSFSKTDLPTGSEPSCVRIADMNGDKKPDVIVADYSSGDIAVFGNNSSPGTLSLSTAVNFNCGTLHPYWITIADLDGDGKNDILTSLDSLPVQLEDQESPIKVFRNNGTGAVFSFTLNPGFPYHIASVRTSVADINGDGRPDVALPFSGDHWSVFVKNESVNGSIAFSQNFEDYLYYNAGSFPVTISMGDLNADGKPDAVIAAGDGFNPDLISVQKNNFWQGPDVNGMQPYTATTGDTVTIYGCNFDNATAVNFGSSPAYSFTVVSSSVIKAVVNRGASGFITVTTPFGTSRYFNDYILPFTYIEPNPKITGISPDNAASGDTIHIYGNHFIDINSVTFGGVPAQSFTVVNKTHIAAVVSAGASGYVKVSNPFNADSIAGFIFYLIRPPVITSFFPITVTTDDTIFIKGKNFIGTNYVRLGGAPASSYTVVSDTLIKAVVGGYNNIDNVYITSLGGSAVLFGYHFYTHPPVFNSFTPNAGDSGTIVTIKGKFLSEVSSVSFGGSPAQSFTIANDTIIKAMVGAGSSGAVSVTNITNTVSLPGFTFIPTFPPPVINSFSPLSGNTGTVVIINGLNFSNTAADNAVFFGAVKANIVSASSTTLSVTVPAGASYGPVTVTVLPNKLTAFSGKPFNPVFSNTDTAAVFSFKQEQDLTGLNDPRRSVITDFDGDGKADIAVTNYANNTVSFFRNISTGNTIQFAGKIDFPTLNASYSITAADINGDGKKDIILADPGFVGILVNNSSIANISFSSEINLSNDRGLLYRNTAVSDWDKNGKPDIAACDYIINDGLPVSVFKNTGSAGNISFAAPQDFAASLSNMYMIGAEDFDGDGKEDLALTVQDLHYVTIMKNNGTGNNISLLFAGNYPVGYEPGGLALGDVDGDSLPDIVVTLKGYNVFSVFRNTSTPGNISFAARTDFNTGPFQEDIVLSDLDGDNKLDVAFTKRYNNSEHSFSVYKNISVTGLPSFEFKNNYITGFGPLQVNAGDLNNDGKPDLITINSTGNSITVFRNRIGTPPTINAIAPSSAGEGTIVTITGEGFTNATAVSFGNTGAASFTVESDSVIKAIVGAGNSGNVNVITPAGNILFPGFIYLTPKYVTQAGAGLKNGSSWANAWGEAEFGNNLYNQPTGTSIWVARGTYKPLKDENGIANINTGLLTFSIPAGVKLYGGFAGHENSLSERNIQQIHGVNITRLSADIGIPNLQDDNCLTSVTLKNCGQNEKLDGFTISNAKNNAIKMGFNAAITSTSFISNCIIADNSPGDAALSVTGNGSTLAKPVINNCFFINNHSASYGAALVTGNCKPTFENCVFYNNGRTSSGGTGASCITFSTASGTISNCDFYENATSHSASNGAALVISNATDSVYINNSIFWNNFNSNNINNLSIVAGSNVACVKNCLFQTQTGGTVPAVLSSSINVNPDFTNAIDADGIDDIWGTDDDGIVPLPFSSVTDKGNNTFISSANTKDITGNSRVNFNTIDMGAYEIQNGFIKICPGGNSVIKTPLSGSSYQWQVNIGNGYADFSNTNHYSGTNTNTLLLDAIPSAWYGYKYRCVTDGNYSNEFILQFTNSWTGAVNNLWENNSNWSCGTLPDANCDVIISRDTAIVNSNPAVKSLTVKQGASLIVNPGFNVSVTGGIIATGTLGGSPGACTPVTVIGVYKQGIALGSSNTLQIQVNVTAAGSYFISTNTANGVSFSGAGNFATTGLQNVTLEGNGTPEFFGNHNFTIQFNGSNCNFSINFEQANPDYFPIITNSNWTYKPYNIAPATTDSLYKKCLSNNIIFNGQSYREFSEINEFLNNHNNGYRKTGNKYYQYYNNFDDLHSLSFLQVNGEIKFLDNDLAAGGSWVNTVTGWVNGGSQNTAIQMQGTILEKNASVTLSTGLNFSNVTKVKLLYFDMSVPNTPNIVYAEERWYSLGTGLIYYSSTDPFGPCVSYALKRYQVY